MSKPTDDQFHPGQAAQRQQAIVLRFVRTSFFILAVTYTLLSILRPAKDELSRELAVQWWIPLLIAVSLFGIALVVDLLTPRKKIATISGVIIGVLAGMLVTLALWFIVDLLLKSWMEQAAYEKIIPVMSGLRTLVGITFCYLGVTTVLQTQDDFRLVIPYVEFAKQIRGVRPLLLDTSALIDGRIVDVAAAGFIQTPLITPRFVVAELQALADSADAMKRAKGRRGLDMITRLQRLPKVDVTLDERLVPGKAVDQMLVELAREMGALIITVDMGLARVASIQNVGVLNMHDLANAVKSSLVPGEEVTLKLIRPGEQAAQAVGYLADGTMVVAEDGAPMLGQTVPLVVTSSLQTSAGRLIFARLAEPPPDLPQAPDAPAPTTLAPIEEPPAESHAANGATPPPPTELSEPPTPSARGPFPPKGRAVRAGTPRNPRR